VANLKYLTVRNPNSNSIYSGFKTQLLNIIADIDYGVVKNPLSGVVEVTAAQTVAKSTRSTEGVRRRVYKISQLTSYSESKPTAVDEKRN
jgi:hypothetical protein